MSPTAAYEFDLDLGVVKEAVRAGVVPGTARAADKALGVLVRLLRRNLGRSLAL